jgi:hypothetical protein
VRWAHLVGAPPNYPANIGPTILSEKIEELLDILESEQLSGRN